MVRSKRQGRLRRALWADQSRMSAPLSSLLLRRVSASSRAALCSVIRSPIVSAIVEPVACLTEGSKPGRSRINMACLCLNITVSMRGAVGSAVTSWEKASGAERANANHSHSTTAQKSASRLAATSAPWSLFQDLTSLAFRPGVSGRMVVACRRYGTLECQSSHHHCLPWDPVGG